MNTTPKAKSKAIPKTEANPLTRALLALRVAFHPNIKFASKHVSGKVDGATPGMNVAHSALLMSASRSCYENAPCGEVALSAEMLSALLSLAGTYSFRITEIAGGSHSKNSRHYAGIAFDIDQINGAAVSKENKQFGAFMGACRKLGATEVLGPGSPGHAGHVHAAWPRGTN
jgi:hypothetical protein